MSVVGATFKFIEASPHAERSRLPKDPERVAGLDSDLLAFWIPHL